MTKERRLGRGLEALLGRSLEGGVDNGNAGQNSGVDSAESKSGGQLAQVRVHQIDSNPYQPRRDFAESELQELADSLVAYGLLQPIVVRKINDRFQLIAGERRLRAAIKSGWIEISAQIREASDQDMAELAMVENLQRKDLNPLEKAISFQQYLHQYSCTQDELAGRLKIDRSTIANLIRLLELPTPVQEALRHGTITQGHARALLPLGDEKEQIAYCQKVQDEGLSVRATEALIGDATHQADREIGPFLDGPKGGTHNTVKKNQQVASLELELANVLGTRVDLRLGKGERGRIVIHFVNHDEFDRLRSHLASEPRTRRAG